MGGGVTGGDNMVLPLATNVCGLPAPVLLTVDERESEHALVYVQGTCEMKELSVPVPASTR